MVYLMRYESINVSFSSYFTAVPDCLLDPIASGKTRATRALFPDARTAGLVPSLNCRRTLSPVSHVSARWDSQHPCARYPYRMHVIQNRAKMVARVGCTTSGNIGATARPDSQVYTNDTAGRDICIG